jgi:hypothetical protein
MTWPCMPLKDGAPAESSCIQFQPEEKVWLFTLHDRARVLWLGPAAPHYLHGGDESADRI